MTIYKQTIIVDFDAVDAFFGCGYSNRGTQEFRLEYDDSFVPDPWNKNTKGLMICWCKGLTKYTNYWLAQTSKRMKEHNPTKSKKVRDRCKETQTGKIGNSYKYLRKKYEIYHWNGDIDIIKGLNEYARFAGYDAGSLHNVMTGKYKKHRDIIAVKLI